MANKVYSAIETSITFQDSGGDVAMTLQNLGFGAGRVSAQYDRGAGSKSRKYSVRAVVQFETTPIVGETVEIYLFQGDGTYTDGTVGTSDAALSSDKRRNGRLIGIVTVDTTSTATNISKTFDDVEIASRYFSLGVWNASAGDNLENTANATKIVVTPVPDEIQ